MMDSVLCFVSMEAEQSCLIVVLQFQEYFVMRRVFGMRLIEAVGVIVWMKDY